MSPHDPLDTPALTWTALLGRWIEFAQASLSIPSDDDGERWRASVPSIINLQAVTFALADLAELPVDERALARDRAEMIVTKHAGELERIWRGVSMSDVMLATMADARRAVDRAVWAGAIELRWPGPGTMVMPAIEPPGVDGTLAIMQPGTIVMPGEPVAWWVERAGVEVDGCLAEPVDVPHQVYRQMDAAGCILRDVVAEIDALPPGLPLLVPLCEAGRPLGHFTMDADDWLARQQASMEGEIEVVWQESD